MKKRKIQTDRIWQMGLALALLLLLCGCTKKEELLLLSGETAQDAPTAGDSAGTSEEEHRDIQGGETGVTDMSPAPVSGQESAAAKPGVIYVHVCGAVVKPGVYELETGSRVYEAVELAGGFAEGAEQNYVNQAQILDDGVKLVIPTQEEASADGERETSLAAGKPQDHAVKEIGIVGGASGDGKSTGQGADAGASAASGGRININTASEAMLCEIPGIGATRAAAIAAYRESHGAFEKPEDIMKVNGIKEGMYEKIKDSISVN